MKTNSLLLVVVVVVIISFCSGAKSRRRREPTVPEATAEYTHRGEIVIRFLEGSDEKEDKLNLIVSKHKYDIVKQLHYPPYVYVILRTVDRTLHHKHNDETVVLELSKDSHSSLLKDVDWALPQIEKLHHKRGRRRRRNNNNNNDDEDPLYSSQWHLRSQNGGFSHIHANVKAAWDLGYTGKGVVVAVVDDGVQYRHPDIKNNYNASISYNYNSGTEDDPDARPLNRDYHGTSIAGIVAATRKDGNCGSGIAYESKYAAIRLIADGVADWQEASALSQEHVDIFTNSWGPQDDGHHVVRPGFLTRETFRSMVENGRNGNGVIYVWAAGNGREHSDNCNYDGYANSRFTIAVSAVSADARYAYYSEPCAALLVSAPSSGSGSHSIATTDLRGPDGYDNSDCTSRFGGTSAAAPIVAGVVALILEANGNLTWRDVQHVLIESATRVDSRNSQSWSIRNGAGKHYSHDYGFGLVNAEEAVKKAKDWSNLPAADPLLGKRQLVSDHRIKDDGSINEFIVTVSSSSSSSSSSSASGDDDDQFHVEHVELELDISHVHRGELRIRLISPHGTVAKLAELHQDHNADYKRWVFSATCFWGENPSGEWRIQIRDRLRGNDEGTIHSFRLNVFGYLK